MEGLVWLCFKRISLATVWKIDWASAVGGGREGNRRRETS